MMHPLDAGAKSLAAKMHVGGNTGTDGCTISYTAMSYQVEGILCDLIRRYWRSPDMRMERGGPNSARSAILELDTIA